MCKLNHVKRFFLLIVPVLLLACSSQQPTASNEHAYLSSGGEIFEPQYYIHHVTADSSDLYFKVKTDHLLYTRSNANAPFTSKLEMNYKLFSAEDSKQILDTASWVINDVDNSQSGKKIEGKIRIPMQLGAEYVLQFLAQDVNRKKRSKQIHNISKTTLNGSPAFLIRDEEENLVFTNKILVNEEYQLLKTSGEETELQVSFYEQAYHYPNPPFSFQEGSNDSFEPDSIFTIKLNESGKAIFNVGKLGFYNIQQDTTEQLGLTLFAFQENYPALSGHDAMINPIRYVTSKKEFEKIKNAENPRLAMEQFWINAAGSKEKAKKLIKSYYERVEEANQEFTTFAEGWMSDRGLIYIIYGKPSIVYRKLNAEIWVYGEESSILSTNFSFEKIDNEFTDNYFRLQRNEAYKHGWYRAVESWRNGRVYFY